MTNRNLILLPGKSASGKTTSLRNLRKPEGVLYLNCESGKELPFASTFKKKTITNPLDIYSIFETLEKNKKCHTIIIDSLTYLMDMFESLYVLTAPAAGDAKFKAWSDYAQYFKKLMQKYVAESSKNVVFLAHTSDILNESEHVMETLVKVKGSLMNQGIESYFNNVIACKKVPLAKLANCESPSLTITPEDELLGYKYVYQTRLTKETVNERIRGPLGLWAINEIFIDNDLQLALDKLQAYYAE